MFSASALIPARWFLGHEPRKQVEAEQRALAELGPDYADYHVYLRSLDMVSRHGVSVTYRAQMVAYNGALQDAFDVQTTWMEPWDGSQ